MNCPVSREFGINVNERERWASLIGGGSLIAYGISRRGWPGWTLAALGGGLLFRGATGHCRLYQNLGLTTVERSGRFGTGRNVSVPYELGIRIDQSVLIHKSREELFKFWRNLENLGQFMDHIKSVKVIDDRRSHWTAKGPLGLDVEWEAEVINEVPNELIGWRSLEGSDVDNAGSVRFASTGDGTEVRVSLQYNPPAGTMGAEVAKLFGQDPSKQVLNDLRRLKKLMETGSVAEGGPARGEPPDLKRTGIPGKIWDRDAVNKASEESFPASDPPSWTPERV